ncbi:hypothetical protein QN277_005710 [Acacia crassicarpa]|uniref:F-box domain-containing protein n=1 Tax=Acacia crassicarpa TaxID=499986 RepID=A0AAE1JXK0_9FABA|nr:hypothetical protein QN277_005710 [Acacia crassicarpa]
MESDKPFLPDDMILNILKRLPVKSLIRSQCVCKHWKNLIKKPSFIAEHLHHSSHQSPSLLLRWPSFASSEYRWGLLDCDMQQLIVQSSSLIDSLSHLRLCGSSNGLLCLKSEALKSILLWNPATREIRLAPITIDEFKGGYCIGFGFSPIVNDYKIVVIYVRYGAEKRGVFRVKVFSLRTRLWKEVEFGNLKGLCVGDDTVTVNGRVFWFGYKAGSHEDGSYCQVVSFDIANEVFSLVPMPAEHDSLMQNLTVHENNLAMLCVQWITADIYCIKLWVMDEGSGTFGERWSWTNTYYSGHCYMLFPLTIWGNEIICEPEFYDESDFQYESQPEFESEGEEDDDPSKPLYLYNLDSNEFKTFDIRNCGNCSSIMIHSYVESLVSISNFHVENP